MCQSTGGCPLPSRCLSTPQDPHIHSESTTMYHPQARVSWPCIVKRFILYSNIVIEVTEKMKRKWSRTSLRRAFYACASYRGSKQRLLSFAPFSCAIVPKHRSEVKLDQFWWTGICAENAHAFIAGFCLWAGQEWATLRLSSLSCFSIIHLFVSDAK